jgi:hypothetical protein
LTQVQGVLVEQCSAVEWENPSLQANFNEEKAQLHQEKEKFLVEKLEVKEVVNRALHSVIVIEIKPEYQVPQQVNQITKAIQQLQQCIADLELRIVPETPQDLRDQREEIT